MRILLDAIANLQESEGTTTDDVYKYVKSKFQFLLAEIYM